MVPFLENLVAHASIGTLLAISLERYYAIVRPLQAQLVCTSARTCKIIIVTWITSVVTTLPFFGIAKTKKDVLYDGTIVEVCRSQIDDVWKHVYINFIIQVFFVIPFVTLAFLYLSICRKLLSDGKSIATQAQASSKRVLQSKHQVIRMLLSIVVLLFICLLPIRVVTIWAIYSTNEQKNSIGLEGYLNLIWFARIMFYINSAANPILYSAVSRKFRYAFKRALGMRIEPAVRRSITFTSRMSIIRRTREQLHRRTFTPEVEEMDVTVFATSAAPERGRAMQLRSLYD